MGRRKCKTLFVGPFAPPYNGDGIKNNYLKEGFTKVGISNICWFDTITRKGLPVLSYIKLVGKIASSHQIIFSLNRNGRLYIIPIFWFFSLFSKIKAVLYVVGGSFDLQLREYMSGLHRRIFVKMLNRLDGVFAESVALKKGLEAAGLNNVELVYNPRRDDGSRWILDNSKRNKCVFVSRVTETKGILVLMQAIIELNKEGEDISLDIYGPVDSDYKDELSEMTQKALGKITYKGIVEPNVVQALLSSYHFLALPTFHPGEGLPGILVEAGMAGIPIVISRFNALPEYFTHNESAVFVEAQSVEGLKAEIRRLTKDDRLAQKLSEGIQKVAVPFRVESIIERSLGLFEQYNWKF